VSEGTGTHCCEAMEWLRHIHTCYCYNVTWRAAASVHSLGYNAHSTRDMTDRDLIRWLLDLDLLITDEFTGLHLHHQHALRLVLFAPS